MIAADTYLTGNLDYDLLRELLAYDHEDVSLDDDDQPEVPPDADRWEMLLAPTDLPTNAEVAQACRDAHGEEIPF